MFQKLFKINPKFNNFLCIVASLGYSITFSGFAIGLSKIIK